MTTRELMREVVQRFPHLSSQQAEAVVKAVFATLTEALVRGEPIELRDFGSFGIKHHQARAIRDPRTGALIAVPAKTVPFFRVAKVLRKRVDGQGVLVQGDREEQTNTKGV